MGKIRIFNCSHDMALASGVEDYVPPNVVAQMEEKYAPVMELLDEWYPEGTPVVWGWNKALRRKLLRQGVSADKMPSETELEILRGLSSREFWVEYCRQLGYSYSQVVVRSTESGLLSTDKTQRSDYPLILKALWSSSGRGNRIIENEEVRDERLSNWKFPCVVDRFYDKVLDFAMEFMVHKDHVEYLGLSVFKASKEGRYEYNYVASQDELRDMIIKSAERTFGDDQNVVQDADLDALKNRHLELLTKNLVGKYQGPVGIDMMVCKGERYIHPCVELNLRMNMGILALSFFRLFGDGALRKMSLESLLDYLNSR